MTTTPWRRDPATSRNRTSGSAFRRCASTWRRSSRSACAASATAIRNWGHGTNHGELETGRESIRLEDFDPIDLHSLHLQSLVIARMGNRTGVGVLERGHFGPHTPSGFTGLTDGYGT